MSLEKHPLSDEESWVFFQPDVGVKAHYLTREVGGDNPKEKVHSLSTSSTCREGIITNTRSALQSLTTVPVPVGNSPWEKELKIRLDIVLDDKRSNGPGSNQLFIDADRLRPEDYKSPDTMDKEYRKIKLGEFMKVADIVAGLPAALLNPNRVSGDWWRTDPEKALQKKHIYWNGVDSTVLQHPAVMATVTGLYRQAYCLCYSGFGPNVLASGSYEEAQAALDSGDWKEIFGQCEKFRPWINVPVPGQQRGGSVNNFAFPWHEPKAKRVSFWQRFVRLQRSLRRYGFDEVLGQDIPTGWDLLGKGIQYSGAYSFWGGEKQLTESHKRIMELGRPLKRKKDDNRSEEAS